jgi:hypothetical protein
MPLRWLPPATRTLQGLATSSKFPAAGGAYTVGNSGNQPFVAQVDPTGSRLLFSAIGVGGSFLALGPSGDIFVAGGLDLLIETAYPTTAGAIQTSFYVFRILFGPGLFSEPAAVCD